MKRHILTGLLFLAAFLTQTSLLNLLSIGGYTPNLLLCLVIVVTFLGGEHLDGMVYGVLFGLLYDLVYSNVIGPAPIGMLLVAAGILALRRVIDRENVLHLWLVSAPAIAVYYGVNWGLCHLAGNPVGFRYVMERVPWSSLYSLVVLTIFYAVAIRYIHSKRRKERR